MNTKEYFDDFEKEVRKVYAVAKEAKAKGLDPKKEVEIPLARSLAEKVVGLIATIYPQLMDSGIEQRIIELEKKWGKLDTAIAFKIAEEIAKQKYCKFANLMEAIDAGIRIGFAYITLGVVSSPIEGYTKLELGKTKEGKEYFKAFFSGPIRSAGTTASCVVLMLIDYLREIFGYAKYDPTEEEIKRYWIENFDYHSRVTNLQYMPTEEEAIFLARNLPIQIAGDPTEKKEVSNYKNLDRVETNFLRGGMALIFSEGLAQKAKKGLRLLKGVQDKGFKSTGWNFLEEYVKLHEQRDKGKKDDSPTYINDLVAGRPIFGHPSKSGGFRLRYGRSRVSGFSANSVHPATMGISDGFLATGTQLKIEKPTKGCIVTSCDTIDGPIVKLFNGSVKKIHTLEEAKKIYSDVEEIIYFGDILIPFSDVLNRNHDLMYPGYVEEWWHLELKKQDEEIAKKTDVLNLNFETAVELSKKYGLPLYPKYIFYWTEISKEQLLNLVDWLKDSKVENKIILPFSVIDQDRFELGKRALELLGVEHGVVNEKVIVNKENGLALFTNLGLDYSIFNDQEKELNTIVDKTKFQLDLEVLEIINSNSKFKIKNKAGDFIGARMGRPEKAKLRKLKGSPNVLFPVGKEGGRLKSVLAAVEVGTVKSAFPIFYCDTCKRETIYPLCESCETETKKMFYSYETKEKTFSPGEDEKTSPFYTRQLDMKHFFEKAKQKIGFLREEVPTLIKGVGRLFSAGKQMEHLSKGLLRAKYDLQVNKDGTIRFDGTEAPIVAFRPREIGVNIEKLKELGYGEDEDGNKLENENQILELKPHDIILPSATESPDERADYVFVKTCNFIDELLVRFYGQKPFYNVKTRDDLVGKLGVFMAPHNCAGVICRFIGFSNTLTLLGSPYLHAGVRRDCDGDEAALMLLGDVLLNFSREFLPSHRGGTQDAPLVLNAKLDPGEVDDQILDFEMVKKYPLELYYAAEKREHSSTIKMPTVSSVMKEGGNTFVNLGFTHDTNDFNEGVQCSTYKTLPTMKDKVLHQMGLVEKLRSANTADTARLILEKHFIRDMRGNLRGFASQSFRCVACNEIVRRPPLSGVCPKCKGKLIFTIHEGGIKKYLELALELVERYNLSTYLKQHIELTKRYIDSIFGKELEKQEKLGEWF
ncbi:DNA polymerase II large subunit [Candidatus Pacearchaeota archaeon]|nr:DNA polymerase II large subunit [Candidatus Pacearchaeota archaeon]